jgi:hypothetical protein
LLPIVMTRPPSRISAVAAWMARNTPRTLMSSIRSRSSRLNASTVAKRRMPAFTTTASIGPKRSTVRTTAARIAAGSALSASTAIARPPPSSIVLTTCSALSGRET